MTFSEHLLSFKGISSGFLMDIHLASDNHLYLVSSDPVMLTLINPNFNQRRQIPLYEYIPSRRNLRLTVCEIGLQKFVIHDSHEHSLLILNFADQTISKTVVLGLDPMTESIFCKGCFLEQYSGNDPFTVVIYHQNYQILVLVRFTDFVQFSYELPFRIQHIDVCGENLVVRSTESNLFELNFTKDFRIIIHGLQQTYKGKIQPGKILIDSSKSYWFNLAPPGTLYFYLDLYTAFSKSTPYDYKEIFGLQRESMSAVYCDSITVENLEYFVSMSTSKKVSKANLRMIL